MDGVSTPSWEASNLRFTITVISISMNTFFKNKACLSRPSEKTQQTCSGL